MTSNGTVINGNLEAVVEELDGMSNSYKDFPDTSGVTTLGSALNEVTNRHYNANKTASGVWNIGDSGAKSLADDLWNTAADIVARHYLGISEEEIAQLKANKDPASGDPNWDNFMSQHLGTDKDGFYNTLKNRAILRAQQVPELYGALADAHVNAVRNKLLSTNIKTNEDADRIFNYLRILKAEFPKALEGLNIPTTYTSVEEVRTLAGTALQAIPRDTQLTVGQYFQGGNKGYRTGTDG